MAKKYWFAPNLGSNPIETKTVSGSNPLNFRVSSSALGLVKILKKWRGGKEFEL
jgi:hypothetical protein